MRNPTEDRNMIKVVYFNKRTGKVSQVIQYKKQDKLGIVIGATKRRIGLLCNIHLGLAEIYDAGKLVAQVSVGYYTDFEAGHVFTANKGYKAKDHEVAHFANSTKTLADALAGTGITL